MSLDGSESFKLLLFYRDVGVDDIRICITTSLCVERRYKMMVCTSLTRGDGR